LVHIQALFFWGIGFGVEQRFSAAFQALFVDRLQPLK
jgi:hypothetical protein